MQKMAYTVKFDILGISQTRTFLFGSTVRFVWLDIFGQVPPGPTVFPVKNTVVFLMVNEFFTSVFNSDQCEKTIIFENHSLNWNTNREQKAETILTVSTDKSNGSDRIGKIFLQKSSSCLWEPLNLIFRTFVNKGSFPQQ